MKEKKELLSIQNLRIQYVTDEATISAVNDISFTLYKGETLGLVGETGAGKTTVALGIMGLIPSPPGKINSGKIMFENRNLLEASKVEIRKIRGKRISMIFQDPMSALNPIDTVGDQISEVIRLHDKLSKKNAAKKAMEMLEMVGIPRERYREYPHQFSGGMKQRIVIAIALACMPELLIADEPTTALDVTIQAQVLELINELKTKTATSIILITHDLGVVAEMCDRVMVVYAGEVMEIGESCHIFDECAHPYTQGLFDSLPTVSGNTKRLNPIPGLMPDPSDLPKGCKFSPRCQKATEICFMQAPELVSVSEGHWARCHHSERQLEED